MVDQLPYAIGPESNAYEWTEKAFDLMTEGLLSVQLTGADAGHVQAQGQCPRCEHDVEYSFDETIVVPQGPGGLLDARTVKLVEGAPTRGKGTRITTRPGSAGLNLDMPQFVRVKVLCQCRKTHPGRSDEHRGCGALFHTDLLAP